jgi:hypothetical protein
MRRLLLPWWAGQILGGRHGGKQLSELSQEEQATLRAISRTFVFVFLIWLVIEVSFGVLLALYMPNLIPWIRLANLVLTPVAGCCSIILARRIVVSRYPERTAIADEKAMTRRNLGKAS